MSEDPDNTSSDKFTLESVEETAPPAGAGKGTWYSYVIGRGKSIITGKHAGTLQSVTAHAETVVEDLNSRSNKQGSIYVSRRTDKKK